MFTPRMKATAIKELETALAALRNAPTQTPCSACDQWLNTKDGCGFWGAVPPDDAQQTGCENFTDSLPF